jgi:Ino eighty subunit 2
MPRSRRATASEKVSTATVSRGPPSSTSKSPESMRLTVKTSSSKLRQATRASQNVAVVVNSREKFDGGQILDGKRARNVRKSYVLESDSDDVDEEMADVVDDDAEGESVEEEEDDDEMDEDDDGLGDDDADGDVDMDVPPPPPVITVSKARSGKQTIIAKPAGRPDTVTVEQKEVELGSEDDELSELDSDLGEEVEEEEAIQTGNEEDGEGEDEEIEIEDDEEELDSDDETPADGSGASTPDLKNLTKRQRARLEEGGSGHLLALPDGNIYNTCHLTPANNSQRFKSRSI